jgi:hypothetical protein
MREEQWREIIRCLGAYSQAGKCSRVAHHSCGYRADFECVRCGRRSVALCIRHLVWRVPKLGGHTPVVGLDRSMAIARQGRTKFALVMSALGPRLPTSTTREHAAALRHTTDLQR